MTVTLTIHDIGRAGHVDATELTWHDSAGEAQAYLVRRFGIDHIRGDLSGGSIGSLNGRVFQASKLWAIQ